MTTSSRSLGVTQLTPPCRIAMPHQPLPALIAAAGDKAGMRFLELFAARIRNRNTRRAYGRLMADFLAWCDDHQVPSIAGVQPVHGAAWIELQQQDHAAPVWPRPICGRPSPYGPQRPPRARSRRFGFATICRGFTLKIGQPVRLGGVHESGTHQRRPARQALARIGPCVQRRGRCEAAFSAFATWRRRRRSSRAYQAVPNGGGLMPHHGAAGRQREKFLAGVSPRFPLASTVQASMEQTRTHRPGHALAGAKDLLAMAIPSCSAGRPITGATDLGGGSSSLSGRAVNTMI
jgi:hypothetical protein